MTNQTDRLRKWETTLRTMAAQRRDEVATLAKRIGILTEEAETLEADAHAISHAAKAVEQHQRVHIAVGDAIVQDVKIDGVSIPVYQEIRSDRPSPLPRR